MSVQRVDGAKLINIYKVFEDMKPFAVTRAFVLKSMGIQTAGKYKYYFNVLEGLGLIKKITSKSMCISYYYDSKIQGTPTFLTKDIISKIRDIELKNEN